MSKKSTLNEKVGLATKLTIKEALKEAKKICRMTADKANNKYDPLHFWQISDDIKDVEKRIEWMGEDEIKELIALKAKGNKQWFLPISSFWGLKGDFKESEAREKHVEKEMKQLLYKLDSAGSTCLRALNTDIRVRKIPTKIMLGYQHIFYYIWQAKEMLGIVKLNEADFYYPHFGYVISEGEEWGSYLRTKF